VKRLGGTLAGNRPTAPGAPDLVTGDAAWGFHAIDGLPDVQEVPGGGRTRRSSYRFHGGGTAGLPATVVQELDRYRDRQRAPGRGMQRTLTVYELAVADALTERRDAGLRLAAVLADDLSAYDRTMTGVLMGRAFEGLDPAVSGVARRTLSDVTTEFETARHRLRLALVAVAVDNGMSTAQIGEAFAFSRQLASRYVNEARDEWPGLRPAASSRRRRSG
jgi:hypothetical protein